MNDINTTIVWPIITSLIASFLFYITLPVVRKYGSTFILIISRKNKRYANYLYKSLSRPSIIEPITTILLITPILLGINILILFTTFSIYENAISTNMQFYEKDISDKIFDLNNKIRSIDPAYQQHMDSLININSTEYYDNQRKTLTKLKTSFEEQLNSIDNIKNSKPNIMFVFYSLLGFSSIIMILVLIQYSQYSFKKLMINKFQDDLKIIRPIISDKMYFKIQQQWTLICNEEDYKRLDDILRKHLEKALTQYFKNNKPASGITSGSS